MTSTEKVDYVILYKDNIMRLIKILSFLIIASACFTGCGAMATVPYSFTKNGNATAEIIFETNLDEFGGAEGIGLGEESKISIQLIAIEGEEIPLPERRTVWNPVSLPAERHLTLITNIFYYYRPDKKGSSHGTGTLLDIVLAPVIIAADIASEIDAISYNINEKGWRNMDVIFNCPPLEAGKNYRLEYIDESWSQKPRLVLIDTSAKKIVYEQEVVENWQVGGKGNWEGEKENFQSKTK